VIKSYKGFNRAYRANVMANPLIFPIKLELGSILKGL